MQTSEDRCAGELARAPLSKLFLPVVLVVSNLKTQGEKRRCAQAKPTAQAVCHNEEICKVWYIVNICNDSLSFSRLAALVRGTLWNRRKLIETLRLYGTAGPMKSHAAKPRPLYFQTVLDFPSAAMGAVVLLLCADGKDFNRFHR